MNQELWSNVDRYLTDLFRLDDAVLTEALQAGAAAGLPSIQVPPNQGKLLHLLARLLGSRNILELGTLGGYSAIWLARALPEGGRLVTLEIDPRNAKIAADNLARAGLSETVEIRLGRALDTLACLVDENRGPFDLIFIDADKVSYPDYLPWALRLSRPGTLIVADNVVRKGAVVDNDSRDANVQGVRRFLELLAAEPRVSATVLQTVSGKGYDGWAMAMVTA